MIGFVARIGGPSLDFTENVLGLSRTRYLPNLRVFTFGLGQDES